MRRFHDSRASAFTSVAPVTVELNTSVKKEAGRRPKSTEKVEAAVLKVSLLCGADNTAKEKRSKGDIAYLGDLLNGKKEKKKENQEGQAEEDLAAFLKTSEAVGKINLREESKEVGTLGVQRP